MTLALDTCSKQTKTAVKKTNDNITTQSGYSPFIDKLSITLTIPPEDTTAIYEGAFSAINCTSIFQSAKWSQRFKICRNIALSGTEERVLFQFGKKTSKGPDCRLEFNPAKLGFDGISSLDTVLSAIFPDGWFYIVEYGRVSRIDIAIDLPGTRMDDFLFLPQQAAIQHRFLGNGYLETIYIGAPGGNQTRIYDKALEQKKKGHIIPQSVRVERTLRNMPIKLHQLSTLKNPFAQMDFVHPIPPPPPGEDERRWLRFKDSVIVRGLSPALALLPEKRRALYRKHLKQNPTSWWNPDTIWKNWPAALDVLA